MGNSQSQISKKMPVKTTSNINKTKKNKIVNKCTKIPKHQYKSCDQIDQGIQDYQYFKTNVSNGDIDNQIGIDTTHDTRFTNNVTSLYDKELNDRNKPYTIPEFEQIYDNNGSAQLQPMQVLCPNCNQQIIPPANVLHCQCPYCNQVMQISNTNNTAVNNMVINDDNTYDHQITTTKEEALEIKNIKYLTNTEKRIMIINNIMPSHIDPLNIQEKENLYLSQLLSKYIALRRIYHPDKSNGSNHMFIKINDAINHINYINKLLVEDKDFIQIKDEFNSYCSNEDGKIPISNDTIESFTPQKFNDFFVEHKYNDPDDGYGDIMEKSNQNREDINIPKLNITNENTFQKQFNEKNIEKDLSKITAYTVPEPITENNNTELVNMRKKYTGSTKQLAFTDYKDAHTFKYTPSVTNKTLSYDEYTNIRSKDPLKLSDEQRRAIEKYESIQDKTESDRVTALYEKDKSISKHYNDTHKFLLNS